MKSYRGKERKYVMYWPGDFLVFGRTPNTSITLMTLKEAEKRVSNLNSSPWIYEIRPVKAKKESAEKAIPLVREALRKAKSDVRS